VFLKASYLAASPAIRRNMLSHMDGKYYSCNRNEGICHAAVVGLLGLISVCRLSYIQRKQIAGNRSRAHTLSTLSGFGIPCHNGRGCLRPHTRRCSTLCTLWALNVLDHLPLVHYSLSHLLILSTVAPTMGHRPPPVRGSGGIRIILCP
jgi:hypothetical protein